MQRCKYTVLPRAALVSYYALILVVLGLSILPGLGVEMLRGSTLSIYGVMLYGLSSGVLMSILLVARSRQMELERMAAASQGQIAELSGQIERASRSISELQQRANQRRQEFRKDVDTQLAQIRLELQADREKFRSSTDELGRTELRAPVSGQVVGLQLQSVGAVLQPGARLMDIVPLDESLVVEARVPPHLIDRIHPDLPADLRFSAFAHSPSLVVQGRLRSVSRDLITENLSSGPVSYYLARIQVTAEGLQTLGPRQMQAGMPVEAIIKTGERSFLTYLLHPLVKRMASAMKEE